MNQCRNTYVIHDHCDILNDLIGRPYSRGVCRKFARPKNLPLTKNLHFFSDQADIQPLSPTHEVIILAKFHDLDCGFFSKS